MMRRLTSRTIAAVCLTIALPLLLLAVVWLPALVMAAIQYYQDLQTPGTPSYHNDTLNRVWISVLSVVVYASAIGVGIGYVFMIRRPRPSRDRLLWIVSFIVAVSDLALWVPSVDFQSRNRDGLLLFVGIPAMVAVLSLFGGWASWRSGDVLKR